MTDTAAASVPPNLRDRTPLALASIVAAFAIFNSVATWIWPDHEGILSFMMLGAFTMQPILLGIWTALGAGSILTRLPIAVPCMLLLFVVPGYIPAASADVRRIEFIAFALAGFAIYVAAIVLFLIFRWFTGFRIQSATIKPSFDNVRIKFSIRYLFALMTVCAIAAGLAAQLKFQTKPPPPSFLGSDFLISMLTYGSALLATMVLPTVVVPLAVLHGRPSHRAIIPLIVFWAIITISGVVVVTFGDKYVEAIEVIVQLQIGAVLAGALAAIPLRIAGLRLVRYR